VHNTLTPLERPKGFESKQFFTEANGQHFNQTVGRVVASHVARPQR